MRSMSVAQRTGQVTADALRANRGTFVVAMLIISLGFWLIFPAMLIFIETFNVADNMFADPWHWGLDNWRQALARPSIWQALWNTVRVWGMTFVFSFPIAVVIAWTLARTRIPGSHILEFLFWVSYMIPGISTTIAWITLMDPDLGLLNKLFEFLPFVEEGPFNIFSVPGIVWAQVMANGIAGKVMLLTPAFRNMDASLEEAARVSGASTLRTMLRMTLPLMAAPMVLVSALQMVRIFQSFEIEQLLGVPFGFYVYSTLIFRLIRLDGLPDYGTATALASVTMILVIAIIPLQRWMLHRRLYTTIRAGFRPSFVDIGGWRWVMLGVILTLLILLTIGPMLVLVFGSFMTRTGYFQIDPIFTTSHWETVLTARRFVLGTWTTLKLASFAAVASPLLFSLVAYVIVRTRWRGRGILDFVIWGSAVIPGMLTGLGMLFIVLNTPFLNVLYGSFGLLMIVVLLQGNTTGVNITKGAIVQIGQDMEDAGRIAGASWLRTYFLIWIPLMMPTLALISVLNFVIAAGATGSIILLASRDTYTLAILALEIARSDAGTQEEASAVGLVLMVLTVGVASVAKVVGVKMGVRQR